MSANECGCGNPEGTNDECERCELLRVEGVLSRLAMRLVDRLAELGEEVSITAEEAGALSAFSRCEQKGKNMEPKQVEHSAARNPANNVLEGLGRYYDKIKQ